MSQLTGTQKQALVTMLEAYFPTKTDFERTVCDLEKKVHAKTSNRASDFSMSKWIRGMMVARNVPAIHGTNRESDLAYFQHYDAEMRKVNRDLSTSATPGSYLVPTIQANEIVSLLSDYGTLRKAGCRIIPMVGMEKLTIPLALAYPTVEWLGENTAQSASDANLGQVTFDLKTCRSLTPIPNELLASSVPAIDAILTDVMSIGIAEAEDKAFFSTTTVTNAPTSLYAQIGNLTSLAAGGNSANGGALTYKDVLAVLAKARNAKAVGPFVWFCNPYTLYNVITALLDSNSRPIFDANVILQKLFGWPIFDTSWIKQDQSVGSGSLQSFMVLANPKYIMIGEPGAIEIAISTEFYFDKNQIAVRTVKRTDWQIAPPLGVTIIKGIN